MKKKIRFLVVTLATCWLGLASTESAAIIMQNVSPDRMMTFRDHFNIQWEQCIDHFSDEDVSDAQLECNELISAWRGAKGESLLHMAATANDLLLAKKLITAGSDINLPDESGVTPLLISIRNHNFELAEYLLETGADPNIDSYENITPLMVAVVEEKIEFVKLLLKYGAKVNQTTPKGVSALVIANVRGFEDIAKLLVSKGAK
jgi:ankyrin repeat protein